MKPALSDKLTDIYNQPSHSLSTYITAAATVAQAQQSSNIFTISKFVSFMYVPQEQAIQNQIPALF
jgi:hypothetical protein